MRPDAGFPSGSLAAMTSPDAEPGHHVDVGEVFERNVADRVDFLRRVLVPAQAGNEAVTR